MAIATLERRLALNPFADRGKGKAPEEEKEIQIERDEMVESALQMCKEIINSHSGSGIYFGYKKSPLAKMALHPTQINLLQSCLKRETRLFERECVISHLIQQSYNADHNGFVLSTGDIQTAGLCVNCSGT